MPPSRQRRCATASSWRRLHGVPREVFELRRRQKTRNQSLSDEPGWGALNAPGATDPLGGRDGGRATAISQASTQSRDVDTRLTCMSVNDSGILEILVKSKMRCE